MKTAFPGFPAEGLKFLAALKKNNNRDWFQARKEVFEQKVRAPMVELAAALMSGMGAFAPDYGGDPNKAVFRIYRDTRFSKDKTPYKTNIAATFKHRAAGKNNYAGYYVSVSPEGVDVGGGVYMPMPQDLLAMRAHVAENHEEVRKILAARALRGTMGELWGERAARAPKGFALDHPAIDLIQCKQYVLFTTLEKEIALDERLYREVLSRFRVMARFVDFLNRALLDANRSQTKMRAFAEF